MNIEMTDTFGGEANYCWVKRAKIDGSFDNRRDLLRKIRKEFDLGGVKLRKTMDCGDMIRWDIVGACVCIFATWEY